MYDQSGSGPTVDAFLSGRGNKRRSSSASSSSSGSGHPSPAIVARCHVVADRRPADPGRLADTAAAQSHRVRQAQHITYLLHRPSLRRHRSPPGCQGARSADSNVDGGALHAAITCCPQSPLQCPPSTGIDVRVAPDSAVTIEDRVEIGPLTLISRGVFTTRGYNLMSRSTPSSILRTIVLWSARPM